jgi:hypothetical protein
VYPAAVVVLDVALFYKRACGWVSVAAEDQVAGRGASMGHDQG